MFETSIKKNINNEQTKLFSNRIGEKISSNYQISTPNLGLPLRQESVKSLNKVNKHYEEFQHALHMLKLSVEELWRLELEQLQNHKSISPNSSNIRFDLQVPSIYTCRAVLPIVSETISSKNPVSSRINSSIILQPSSTTSIHETISNKMGIKEKMFQSNTQSISSKQKSTGSLLSRNKKQKQYESGDNVTKYSTKTALLHLKFRCSKHIH
jgi:hypothetical protein